MIMDLMLAQAILAQGLFRSMSGMKSKMNSKHQLTPFDVGQVKAHMSHGLSALAISKKVLRRDGKTTFGETAIENCMAQLQANARWRGDWAIGSGRPRKTTKKQDKEVERWVLHNRGKEKVTVSRIKKEFPYLRKLGDSLVEERLHDVELKWLRRRKKSIITKSYLQPRIDYCHGVKRKHDQTLEKWAYTDGTTYFLDRDESEAEHSQRRALGTHVWRRSENKDALHQDCMGPSSYSKAQGIPVKIWGMLACGVLHIHILDEGENMDTMTYVELIEDKFDKWRGNCEHLVCDFESCLRGEQAVRALTKANLTLVEGYPQRSQDFNAIENVWDILKRRLDETMPVHLEPREDFIARLKVAVQWINRTKGDLMWTWSTNQKERAADCLQMQRPGGRTKW